MARKIEIKRAEAAGEDENREGEQSKERCSDGTRSAQAIAPLSGADCREGGHKGNHIQPERRTQEPATHQRHPPIKPGRIEWGATAQVQDQGTASRRRIGAK